MIEIHDDCPKMLRHFCFKISSEYKICPNNNKILEHMLFGIYLRINMNDMRLMNIKIEYTQMVNTVHLLEMSKKSTRERFW